MTIPRERVEELQRLFMVHVMQQMLAERVQQQQPEQVEKGAE